MYATVIHGHQGTRGKVMRVSRALEALEAPILKISIGVMLDEPRTLYKLQE